ncbi:hypothetical protein [Massilia sp. TSP1-1-2]|uniref:hypothetical protein n=1 Tax=Massilia sp. TSP1-1-2 TaxID=2804649 RepID=UPI003CEE28CC
MAPLTTPTRSMEFSWGASMMGGCVAIAGGAFFGTLLATVSMRLSMANGLSADQALATAAVYEISPLTILGPLLALLSEGAGGYVAAKLGGAKARTQALAASFLPVLFLAIMYVNPGSQFGLAPTHSL